MLNYFEYIKINFTLLFKEETHLPPYKGSAIRGGLGHVLRKLVCTSDNRDCINCNKKFSCQFAYIFMTPVPKDAEVRNNSLKASPPFVIEPPMTDQNLFKPMDTFEFSITLFGKGINYLPYFIYSIEELGNQGLGKTRGKYDIISVTNDSNNGLIYKNGTLYSQNITRTKIDFAEEEKLNQIYFKFNTPVRIIKNKKLVKSDFTFELIMRNIFRRLDMISYFHFEKNLDIIYKDWIEKSKEIKKVEENLQFYDWKRRSGRTNKTIQMGGFVGNIVFEGDLSEFMPFIKMGEIIHLGKGCTFGMGEYKTYSL